MAERSSIFDMIGPIMIGPSSSHTGAVVRIGRVARHLFGEAPAQANITFYNSFSRTYEGHGSDKAIIAGLLDMAPDDARIKESFDHAKAGSLNYHFKAVFNASSLHPNSIRVQVKREDRELSLLGISRGGGLIAIMEVADYKCNFSSQLPTLIVTAEDINGSIAFVANVVAHDDCNIATMTVNRRAKKELAMQVLELDSPLRPLTLQYLESLSWISEVRYLSPLA